MARTIKPTHVRAIAELLEEGALSAEELAKACIRKVDELREDDKTFAVVGEWSGSSGSFYLGYGPYNTKNQAHKAIEKGKGVPVLAEHVAIVPLFTPEHVERIWKEVDEPPPSQKWVKEVREDVEYFKNNPGTGKNRKRRW